MDKSHDMAGAARSRSLVLADGKKIPIESLEDRRVADDAPAGTERSRSLVLADGSKMDTIAGPDVDDDGDATADGDAPAKPRKKRARKG